MQSNQHINPLSNTSAQNMSTPSWFWAALLSGIVIRLYFVFLTTGTYDILIWAAHSSNVDNVGLINYYHKYIDMNHPPFMAYVGVLIKKLTAKTGFDFQILFRLPFALLDMITGYLLLLLFKEKGKGYIFASLYWLHPVAALFSGYHGNTDSGVAFFLISMLLLLSKDKHALAGAIFGLSLWIKIPGIIAGPAVFFYLKGVNRKAWFCLGFALVFTAGYLPAMLIDPVIVIKNVFGYDGRFFTTPENLPIWGLQIFVAPLLNALNLGLEIVADFTKWVSLALLVLVSYLKKDEKDVFGLGLTIASCYIILFGITFKLAFQYFAWAVPLMFFLDKRISITASILISSYIYGVYWVSCGDPFLLGAWDLTGDFTWNTGLLMLRNASMAFYFFTAIYFIFDAISVRVKK